jgi:DNA mismatch endonuclease (patch repair protein)
MDVLTVEQRRKNMQAIKSEGTRCEVKLAKALWKNGLRYRKNDKSVFGKPDLTFRKLKVAIFVDSEYFHGRNWEKEKYRIKTNREFWWRKIERNIERDKKVNKTLKSEGWTVLRFWSDDVNKNLNECVKKVLDEIENKK